jgi:plastocyanin
MGGNGWKHLLVEAWAFVAVAIIAFVGGFLIGDLGGSPPTETVYVATTSTEAEETGAPESEAPEPSGEPAKAEPEAEGIASSPGGQIFTSAGCGSCHTLAAAGSTGETGPNLDEFLAPDDTTEAVEEMIVDPNAELAEGYAANVMPTTYRQTMSNTEVHQLAEFLVATTPAKPNPKPKTKSSSGAAEAGAGETLDLAASATQLAFDKKELTSKSGKVTIDFENPAVIEHDVAIEQNGKLIAKTPLISEGKASVSAELKPGTYTFICTVPGHAEAGMEGTLTVK